MITVKFRKDYENKTLEEIIEERNKVLIDIKEYEDKFIFSKPDPLEMFPKPSPQTIYSVNNDDLIMLTELINERLTQKKDCL